VRVQGSMQPGKYGMQTINQLTGECSRPTVECTHVVRETRSSVGIPSSAKITRRAVSCPHFWVPYFVVEGTFMACQWRKMSKKGGHLMSLS
jgi:hypothetical protein